ncbi:hypothetical protein AVEN_146955-1, partial [Araneus ventricosus]
DDVTGQESEIIFRVIVPHALFMYLFNPRSSSDPKGCKKRVSQRGGF